MDFLLHSVMKCRIADRQLPEPAGAEPSLSLKSTCPAAARIKSFQATVIRSLASQFVRRPLLKLTLCEHCPIVG